MAEAAAIGAFRVVNNLTFVARHESSDQVAVPDKSVEEWDTLPRQETDTDEEEEFETRRGRARTKVRDYENHLAEYRETSWRNPINKSVKRREVRSASRESPRSVSRVREYVEDVSDKIRVSSRTSLSLASTHSESIPTTNPSSFENYKHLLEDLLFPISPPPPPPRPIPPLPFHSILLPPRPRPKSLSLAENKPYGAGANLRKIDIKGKPTWVLADGARFYVVKKPTRQRNMIETEKECRTRVTAEFCIASILEHVNIITVLDLVEYQVHGLCMLTELCPGGSLYDAIKRGEMSLNEMECCFKQLVSGVRYLHTQGVAHRNIQPEGVFFDGKGCLKIGEFGVATVFQWESGVKVATDLCGSEPYIAPEQFLKTGYDPRFVDIWACGIVYYCLYLRRLPWRVARQADLVYASYTASCNDSGSEPMPYVIEQLSPTTCWNVIRRMLEPKPTLRATIEQVFEDDWIKDIDLCCAIGAARRKAGHVHAHAEGLAGQTNARLQKLDWS